MTLAAPSEPRVEKYELLEEIGHGGMATVYRARDPRLSRDVAVKVIHRHLRESKEVARRFGDEARAVAKLRHDNIVEIFDVADDDAPERYLVAELVRGASLRKILQEQGPLPAEVSAAIAIMVADGLAHAHERGVVHRDVKPENVLFALPQRGADVPHVQVKITDFGIAKMLDQQGVTATGQVLGSPAYMAPEQIECGDVDPRSDVFSLGVLLYECMVGHLPFEGKNPAQVLRRVLDGDFAPADQEQPTVGATFSAIAAKALAQAPDQRFSSMGDFARTLRAELEALGEGEATAILDAYFADPGDYQTKLVARAVPRLLARGKDAHKRGDIVAAAGHFNRALAFAPHDRDALALVNGLSRRKARRALLVRAGSVGAALVVVAGATTVVVRTKPWRRPVVPVTPIVAPDPSDSASPPPVVSAAAIPSSTGMTRDRVLPPVRTSTVVGVGPPGGRTGSTPASTDRTVRFLANVPAAKVSIDGGAPGEIQGVTRTMSVGTHHYSADVDGSDCCKSVRDVEFHVTAAAEGDSSPQQIMVHVPLRQATLVSEGPPTALIRCPLLFPGGGRSARGSYTVDMKQLSETYSCTLVDEEAPQTKTFTLHPGKTTPISWLA